MVKKLVACLTAVCCLAGGLSAMAVCADEFNEPTFYIVAKNSSSDDYLLLHFYIELSLWTGSPDYDTLFIPLDLNRVPAVTGDKTSGYQYGDVFIIDGGYSVGLSYPPSPQFDYEDVKEVHYAGNCKDLLESRELTLTKKKEQDYGELLGLESITFYFEDDAGNEYQYFEYYNSCSPEIDLNLYDIGNKVTFAVYQDTLILPLEEDSDLHLNPVQPQIIKGDVSGDEEINILDVIEINRAVLGKTVLTDDQSKSADVDGNGIVDTADSLMVLKYLVGLIESL